jgi:hypothetical protein
MAYSSTWRDSFFDGYENGRSSGNALAQRVFGAAALGCVAFSCAFMLWTNLPAVDADQADDQMSSPTVDQTVEERPALSAPLNATARHLAVAHAYAKLSTALKASTQMAAALNAKVSSAVSAEVALFDSQLLGFPAGSFIRGAALPAGEAPEATAALPRGDQTAQNMPRPAPRLRLSAIRSASVAAMLPAPPTDDTPPEKPSIFERLFGKPAPVTLAYAAPDDGGLTDAQSGRYDRYTAVYDISAHTVYLPDGTKLEAHSGLGAKLDDPRHVDERMHGATPPTLYDLRPRESLFHGVQALRLIPVDETKVYGRSGLLAHTFMLGPNGDSNGCVSFRNYTAFLRAYMNHEIKRLAVVAHLE